MSTKNGVSQSFLTKVIRGLQLFGSLYMFGESAVHLFNLRMRDVVSVWPESALTYSIWMERFYGSFILFAAIVLLIVRRDLRAYRQLLILTAVFALFHAILLLTGTLTVDFNSMYGPYASLSFWVYYYNQFLYGEILLLLVYSLLVYLWFRSET